MANPTIISLAVLKVNWDERGLDYIGSFLPFVFECLRAAPAPQIALEDVRDRMQQMFGLKMPLNSLKTILQRAAKKGYLKREHGIYIRADDKIPDTNFKFKRDRALRELNALAAGFRTYCQERHSVDFDLDQAEAALHEYLSSHSDQILNVALGGSPIPEPSQKIKGAKYLTNSFIRHIFTQEPQLFEYLETLVKGTILANALLYQDIGKVEQHFRRVEVFFDTPFLLAALGLAGESQRLPCQELLDLLYAEGAQLCCFDHTVREMTAILDTSSHLLRQGKARQAHGASIRFFMENKWKSSDIELAIAQLANRLQALRISVKPHPEYIAQLGIDEGELTEQLKAGVSYTNPDAAAVDVASLSAVYRLRGGRSYNELETCRALFVTPNASVVKTAWRFFGNRGVAPVAITDTVLTHLVWLKRPTAMPDLPRQRVIANCFAALEPSNSLWDKYLGAVEELKKQDKIEPNSYAVLRYSLDAKYALMDLTLGDVTAFTEGTLGEVLKVAEGHIRAESEAVAAAERQKRHNAEEALKAQHAEQQALITRIAVICQRTATVLSNGVLLLAVLILLVCAYVSWQSIPIVRASAWVKYGLVTLQGLVALWGIGNYVFGITLKTFQRDLEVYLAKRFVSWVRVWLRLNSATAISET